MHRFLQHVRRVDLNAPEIPYLSNLTGRWITTEQATDPGYWAQQLRQTVRFSSGIQELLKHSDHVLLEVGPGQTLTTLVKRHPQWIPEHHMLNTMRHPSEPHSDAYCLLRAYGQLWVAGGCTKSRAFYIHENRRRVALPTYPFERRRYWIEPSPETSAESQPAVQDTRRGARVSKIGSMFRPGSASCGHAAGPGMRREVLASSSSSTSATWESAWSSGCAIRESAYSP